MMHQQSQLGRQDQQIDRLNDLAGDRIEPENK